MLKRWALLLALVAASIGQPPALAQADEAADISTFRGFADITSGQLVGNGERADKVLTFGRNAQNEVVVREIRVLALGGEWMEPDPDALAIMRTRAATANDNRAPDPADVAFVRRTGARIFIVGEWASPPVVWELTRDGGQVRVREIDAAGAAGPWRTVAA